MQNQLHSLLLTALAILCQKGVLAQYFQKTYHNDNPIYPIEIRDVQLTSDNHYIVGFDQRDGDSLGFPKAGFMKLNNNGDVLWSRMLDVPNCVASCSYEVAERSNGNYYLFGLAQNDSLSTNDSTGLVMDPFLCEYDPNGTLQYYRYYESPANQGAYSVNSMEVLPSDSLAFLVSVNNYVEVIKTDADGHLDWATRVYNNINLYGKNPGFDFIHLPDNTLLVVCKTQEDLSILKLNAQGQVMWFRFHSVDNYSHIKSLCLASNGELYAVGYSTSQGVPYNVDVLLLSIDPSNGDITMAKSFPFVGFNYLTMAEIYEDNNSLVLSLCGPTFSSIFEEHMILRTDYQGNFIEGILTDNIILSYNTMEKFNDSTYALSGNMYYYTYDGFLQIHDEAVEACYYSDIYNVITEDFTEYFDTTHTYFVADIPTYYSPNVIADTIDIIDSLRCEHIGLVEQKKLEIELFPNPTHDLLNIVAQKEGSSFQITDLNGTVIQVGMLHSGHNTLSLADLAKGIYLLHVSNEEARIVEKIVLN